VDEDKLILRSIPMKMGNILIEKIIETKTGNTEAIIILPEKGEVKVINEVGYEIIELIDGKQSLQNIIDHLRGIYDIPDDQITEDVLSFIDILKQKGIIKLQTQSDLKGDNKNVYEQ